MHSNYNLFPFFASLLFEVFVLFQTEDIDRLVVLSQNKMAEKGNLFEVYLIIVVKITTYTSVY
jgi:hypothetical protein